MRGEVANYISMLMISEYFKKWVFGGENSEGSSGSNDVDDGDNGTEGGEGDKYNCNCSTQWRGRQGAQRP